MFAGPNGSGKSTLKSVLSPKLLGTYINPDEIEKEIRTLGFLDLEAYGVSTRADVVLPFFKKSAFLQRAGLLNAVENLQFAEGRLVFANADVNAYLASVTADFLRQRLLERETSFTLETVMSSDDKVALLKQARALGYRTYLYYVATVDPIINISRVQNRVRLGGHPVPEDKIVSRYVRSLDLLMDAMRNTNRAYIFDNSSHQQGHVWLAEVTDGKVLEMKTDQMPGWFKRAVWDKIAPAAT